jgi:hypothetical protein
MTQNHMWLLIGMVVGFLVGISVALIVETVFEHLVAKAKREVIEALRK